MRKSLKPLIAIGIFLTVVPAGTIFSLLFYHPFEICTPHHIIKRNEQVESLSPTLANYVEMYVAIPNFLETYDPMIANDFVSKNAIMQVIEGLYIRNYSSTEMEPIPNLADARGTWSIDGNGNITILTVPLKEGVTFHDGSKFNASTVKWNFDRLQFWTYGIDIDADTDDEIHPIGAAYKHLFKQGNIPILNRTEIIDEYQVRFHLNMPSWIWENLLADISCAIMLPDVDYEYGEKFHNEISIDEDLTGTGPFKLMGHIDETYVVFEYNKLYHTTWGSDHVAGMVFQVFSDAHSVEQALQTTSGCIDREIHWAGDLLNDFEIIEQNPSLWSVNVRSDRISFISMDHRKIPFEVRKAIQFASNQTQFSEISTGNENYPLQTPIPFGMEYYDSELECIYDYNISSARESILNITSNPNPDTVVNFPEIITNVSISGLSNSSSDLEWIQISESATPLAWYNFTFFDEYDSENDFFQYLKTILKKIGLRVEFNLYNAEYCYDLAYHEWKSNACNPIEMIEPLYHSDSVNNPFSLNSSYLNDLIDQRSFYDSQEFIMKNICCSLYLMQHGKTLAFDRNYIDQDSIRDLFNIYGDFYVLNVRFTPPTCKPTYFSCLTRAILLMSFGSLWVIGIGGFYTSKIVRKHRTSN